MAKLKVGCDFSVQLANYFGGGKLGRGIWCDIKNKQNELCKVAEEVTIHCVMALQVATVRCKK